MVPFVSAVTGMGYVTYKFIKPSQVCNPGIDKETPKVVHMCDIEDISDDKGKASYCRCWRSKKVSDN